MVLCTAEYASEPTYHLISWFGRLALNVRFSQEDPSVSVPTWSMKMNRLVKHLEDTHTLNDRRFDRAKHGG